MMACTNSGAYRLVRLEKDKEELGFPISVACDVSPPHMGGIVHFC